MEYKEVIESLDIITEVLKKTFDDEADKELFDSIDQIRNYIEEQEQSRDKQKYYKAFNQDLTCRGFKYEIGKTYELDGELEICKNGFHFCTSIADCYDHYPVKINPRICEVEPLGDIESKWGESTKYCTNKIKILREISDDQKKCNIYNSSIGYFNTGRYNTGNGNSGDFNSGICNTGNYNTGDFNSGNHNNGNFNSGSFNIGRCNIGNYNTGHFNSGHFNVGNGNVGHFNCGNYNNGIFCTNKSPKIKFFDKESDWTIDDFDANEAIDIMINLLSRIDDKQIQWDNLSEEDKQIVYDLPNFDAEKFYKCTGIIVNKDNEKIL